MSSNKRKQGTVTGESSASKAPKLEGKLQACPLFKLKKETAEIKQDQLLSQGLEKCNLFGISAKTATTIDQIKLGNCGNLYVVGRICYKSDVKTWDNGKNRGKSFCFNILDGTGEISITVFNEKIEEVFDLVEVNGVLQVSGFRVKTVDANYPKVPSQTLELILNPAGSVEKSLAHVPDITFEFQDIESINSHQVGSTLDFLGIVYSEDGLIEGVGKNGRDYQYRVLNVTDKTEFKYSVKIWGQEAIDFELTAPKTIVLRRAKLVEHEEIKSLGVTANTLFLIDPKIPEANDLAEWFRSATSNG